METTAGSQTGYLSRLLQLFGNDRQIAEAFSGGRTQASGARLEDGLCSGQQHTGADCRSGQRCSAGIFLFTGDDPLTDRAHKDKAVPRDNVVFEAGYFSHAKGKGHVLIIREAGAKMPADLGGDIYASLQDKSKIAPIKETIRRFIDGL